LGNQSFDLYLWGLYIYRIIMKTTEVEKAKWYKRIWQILNGNKTIIASMLLLIATNVPIPEPFKSIIVGILSLLGGGALAHHAVKGYFSPNKGH